MMSKKQFACMLTLHIVYLLVGAAIFYHIESPLEMQQRAEDKLERLEIQNLLYENYIPNDPEKQDTILRKLSQYCGKSMFNYTTEDEEGPYKWDFYHSFFFSYTVVSTIGYGNLAPTTHLSRILMIFYGLFGIPINGILLANLGEYFGLQLISVYRKYKKRNEKRGDNLDYFFNNLGMLGQIILYLVPGFLFFMFLPACIFVVFEGWDYVGAVYYAFVTLTTIGFGDMVAGTINNGFAYGYFFTYQLFLIVWITFGLGYIVMLLGFITSGMRSERVHRFEQKVACQLKNTHSKILQGFTRDLTNLRKIINEANLLKLKPVYVEPAPYLYRSASCPILTFDVEPRGPVFKRRRANSENIQLSARDMLRIQSDTDLLGIDKEKTFTAAAIVKPAELLARVVNVLGGLEHQQQQDKGVHMFDDDQILASEKPPIFTIGANRIANSPKRNRALSVAVPNYRKESVPKLDHDFTWTNGESAEKFRKEANYRSGKLSLPSPTTPIPVEDSAQPQSFFSRLFKKQSSSESPTEYIKNTLKGRISISHNADVKEKPRRGSIFPSLNASEGEKTQVETYKEKTKRGRHSIFPTFDFNQDEDENEDDMARKYKEKTKRGRHSIFPTFDFSEDENETAMKAYQKKTKRHSIFPTFDFSEDDQDEREAKDYKERTRAGRHSIFPTFDFSDTDDDGVKRYKENTDRGRRSIFPTFDFSHHKKHDDDEAIDEEEVQKYQNRTKKGRFSLFPTFGRSKKTDENELTPDNDEITNYRSKTRQGRGSLFPSFGKDPKNSTPEDRENSSNDLEASIRQYQNQSRKGRNSLFAGDLQSYMNTTSGGRSSLFSNDLENYRNRTRNGRPSLFDTDVNISSLPESEQVEVLEQTSVADLLRALAVLESVTPQSSRDTVEPPGLFDFIGDPTTGHSRRRDSLRPEFNFSLRPDHEDHSGPRRRKPSARNAAPQFTPTLATVVAGAELQTTAAAARENRMSMITQPPSYERSISEEYQQTRIRRYSPAPGGPGRTATGPVPRLFSRMRSVSSVSNEEDSSSRRGSLTNIVIDNNKNKT